MISYHIRRATPGDVEEITSLFRDTVMNVNRRDYSEIQVKAWAEGAGRKDRWLKRIRDQYLICCFGDDRLTGFASLEDSGFLDLMYVHTGYQRKGIATLLLYNLEQYAKKRAIPRIHSDVSITARSFFESRGFKLVQEQRRHIRETEFINYRMEKIIS